jgi:hypothetical protein
MGRTAITEALALIFQGIAKLKDRFPDKAFTIDGRLVGDIGEVLAALEYQVELYKVQTPDHDGVTPDGRKVQVKATFKDKLTMTSVPDLYLGIQLSADGNHREVYNGPGAVIAKAFAHRVGIGVRQLSFPISALEKLSQNINPAQRVLRRAL